MRSPARLTSLLHRLMAAVTLVMAVLLVATLLALNAAVAVVWAFAGMFLMSMTFVLLPLAIIVGAAFVHILAINVNAVRTVHRTGGLPDRVVEVLPGTAPRLHQLVAELANRMKVEQPRHLWLTPHANASVHESHRLLRRPRRIRHLCIGAPLLAGLTIDQLRAVLCHELGHNLRRHAPFSRVVYRGSEVLRSILAELERTTLPTSDVPIVDRLQEVLAAFQYLLFRVFAACYDLITLAVRRHREYEADRISATVVGPATTAEALVRAHTISTAWPGFQENFVVERPAANKRNHDRPLSGSPLGHQRLRIQRPCPTGRDTKANRVDTEARMDEPFHSFAAKLNEPDAQPTAQAPGSSSRWSLWTSHPPLHKRLAALHRIPDLAHTSGDSTPALDLLYAEPDLLARVTCAAFPHIANHRPVLETGNHASEVDAGKQHDSFLHRCSARLPAMLLTGWFLILICNRVFLMFGAPLQLTITYVLLVAITGAIILTALLRPPPSVRPKPRRLRRWINSATALTIAFGASAHLVDVGDAGRFTSGVILALAIPFLHPNRRVSPGYAIPAFIVAVAIAYDAAH